MSVAAGLAAAGNYIAQPLLDLIGRELRLGPSLAALTMAANGAVLLVSTALTALTSVGAQVVVPFVVTLAALAELRSSLLARTASGPLSEPVYWVNAVLMALMAVCCGGGRVSPP